MHTAQGTVHTIDWERLKQDFPNLAPAHIRILKLIFTLGDVDSKKLMSELCISTSTLRNYFAAIYTIVLPNEKRSMAQLLIHIINNYRIKENRCTFCQKIL